MGWPFFDDPMRIFGKPTTAVLNEKSGNVLA